MMDKSKAQRSNVEFRRTAGCLCTAAAAISQQTGLLSGDALVVAVMRANGLTHLASEGDFECAAGLTCYAPA